MDTTIILTPIDVERFKLFQKYYDAFIMLDKLRAFELEFGKVTLNFAFGEVQNVVKEEMVYKRKP